MELDRQQDESPGRVAVRRRSAGYWGAIGLTLAGALLFLFLAVSMAARHGVAINLGWSIRSVPSGYLVRDVEHHGAADGSLQPGDRVVAIGGDRRAGVYGPLLPLIRMPVGNHYQVEVIRNGFRFTVTLLMRGEPARFALRESAPILFIALMLYGVAVWIGLVRPDHTTARLAAISFFMGAMVFAAALLAGYPGWSDSSAAVAAMLITIWRPWHLAFAYDFLSRFPNRVAEPAGLRALRWSIYAIAAALWLPLNLTSSAYVLGLPAATALRGPGFLNDAVFMTGFEFLCAMAMCVALTRNYIRLPGTADRRRFRWAGLGLACAIVPFSLLTVVKLTLGLAGRTTRPAYLEVIDRFGTLMVGLAPIMVGYAVVKHRVLGIRVVVRRGLQYLLARNVLRLIAFLPLLIVLFEAVRQSNRSLADLALHSSWSFYVAVAAALGLSLRYRPQMRLWLDRKFFRVDYEREQILGELIEQIKSAESEEEISLVVVREVERALSVDGIHVLLRDDTVSPFRVAFSYPPREGARIRDFVNGHESFPPGSSFVTLYEQANAMISETPEGPDPWRELLITPLAGSDRGVTGFLALGPKRSEEPYTPRDRDLLLAIAGQMAVMYEVLRLKQRIRVQEKVRVEVLGRLRRDRIQLLNECPRCGRCYSSEARECSDDGAELSLTLPVERVIEGKYRLERKVGRGGMGVVYEARDLRLDRDVAVKIMTGELFGNQRALERFEREARTAAGLKHPNIVAIYDFGPLPAGGAYLVMELIRGCSWREELKTGESIALGRVSQWLEQLCAATTSAHALGIVHRDLKPENVMIAEGSPEERVVVLDFGLAKARIDGPRAETELTVAGSVLGTRAYMSPEQRAGEPIDVRTDVYSIAVMAVETLCGVAPPRTGASREWMRGALAGLTAPGSPLTLVLEQALAEIPADRLVSARELGAELVRAIPGSLAYRGSSSGDASSDTISLEAGTDRAE